jgi:hypothetical protein
LIDHLNGRFGVCTAATRMLMLAVSRPRWPVHHR